MDQWITGQLANNVVSIINLLLLLYTVKKIKKVEAAADGLTTALVKTTGDAEHAKGKIEGRDQAFSETEQADNRRK